jgi:hypothetical protein
MFVYVDWQAAESDEQWWTVTNRHHFKNLCILIAQVFRFMTLNVTTTSTINKDN